VANTGGRTWRETSSTVCSGGRLTFLLTAWQRSSIRARRSTAHTSTGIPVRSLLALVSRPPTTGEIDALHRLQFTMEQSTYAGPRKIAERIGEILSGGQRSLLPGGSWSARVVNSPRSVAGWC
jgi:hypothetical protein